jgi:hypothetical protein
MNDLTGLIYQWGLDRQIIQNGKYETQWLKLISEYGELCDSLAKGQPVDDDLGDMYVVLVMMCGINEIDPKGVLTLYDRVAKYDGMAVMGLIGILHSELGGLRFNGRLDYSRAADMIACLNSIAIVKGTTLDHCIGVAYNDIKDRKGHLNADGVFIKESNNE